MKNQYFLLLGRYMYDKTFCTYFNILKDYFHTIVSRFKKTFYASKLFWAKPKKNQSFGQIFLLPIYFLQNEFYIQNIFKRFMLSNLFGQYNSLVQTTLLPIFLSENEDFSFMNPYSFVVLSHTILQT